MHDLVATMVEVNELVSPIPVDRYSSGLPRSWSITGAN